MENPNISAEDAVQQTEIFHESSLYDRGCFANLSLTYKNMCHCFLFMLTQKHYHVHGAVVRCKITSKHCHASINIVKSRIFFPEGSSSSYNFFILYLPRALLV